MAPGEQFCGNCGALATTTAPDQPPGRRPSNRTAIIAVGVIAALVVAVVVIANKAGDEVEKVKDQAAQGEAAAPPETQTAPEEPTGSEALSGQEEQLQQLQQQLQDQRRSKRRARTRARRARARAIPPGHRSCGGAVTANSVTTCPFAQNVRDAYYSSGRSSTVSAYSPALGRSITMSCTGSSPHFCTGGNNAEVKFR